MPVWYTKLKKSPLPWEGGGGEAHPFPTRSLRSLALAPHWQILSPLIGVKEIKKRGRSRGLVYAMSYNLPLIMVFSVQNRPFWYTKKKSPYRVSPPSPSPARSLRSLALPPPPVTPVIRSLVYLYFFEALNAAFQAQMFSGFPFYTLSEILITESYSSDLI